VKKTITNDCSDCKFCVMTDYGKLMCTWGKTKKILVPKKRKTVLYCNLKHRISKKE